MTFEYAIALTATLLGLALIQQSAEYLKSIPNSDRRDRLIMTARLTLSALLVFGIAPAFVTTALVVIGLWLLVRFDGPYNGGSDRMSLLVLLCLWGAHLAPTPYWREIAFAYLAVQLVLSYFLSGAVKIVKVDWRNGDALRDVFLFSAYPASEAKRQWARRPKLLLAMSWIVMVFELAFPLALISQPLLIAALVCALLFHLANAFFFGLNRFVWAWIAAYPSLLWLQAKMLPG